MGRKILLDKINVPGIRTYEVYRKEGGYASVEKAIKKMLEIPLKLWVEKGDSKVKLTYGFKLWFDLFEIQRKYKKIEQNNPTQTYSK